MNHAYICDAIRTPIGRYGGALKDVRADDLAAIPLRAHAAQPGCRLGLSAFSRSAALQDTTMGWRFVNPLADERAALRHGLTPRARILGMATAGVAPRVMGIGPAPASQNLLAQLGMTLDQIDVIELNEAFAAQGLAVLPGALYLAGMRGAESGLGQRRRRLL